MTPQEALQLIYNASQMASMTLQDHMKIQKAVEILVKSLQRLQEYDAKIEPETQATNKKANDPKTTKK